MRHTSLLAALLLTPAAWCAPLQLGPPEDSGPFAVGWQDVSFSHPLAGNPQVDARLYYPAAVAGQGAAPDPSGGPFPQVGMLHGYFAFVDYYDDLCTHLASWGFFVASVATESGFFMSVPDEAADAHAMLAWVEEQAGPGGPFDGMVTLGAAWSTVGHSNGGAASFHLANAEPRVRHMVLLEPNWLAPPGVSSFDGAVMVVGASQDIVAPAALNAAVYFDQLVASPRRFYTVIEGSGHNGSLDFPFEITTLSHEEAQALHRRLTGGFLRAEVQGEEDLYAQLIGGAAQLEPLDPRSRATDPVLWALPSGVELAMGIGADEDDALGVLAISTLPATLPTAFGLVGVDLGGALVVTTPMAGNGSVDVALPHGPSVIGLAVLVQGLRLAPSGAGAVTRVAAAVL